MFLYGECQRCHHTFAGHLKLTREMCPKTKEEDKMFKVPYASAVGSLMYAMVYTKPDIVHVVGVVSRYMSHLGILRYLKRNIQ